MLRGVCTSDSGYGSVCIVMENVGVRKRQRKFLPAGEQSDFDECVGLYRFGLLAVAPPSGGLNI